MDTTLRTLVKAILWQLLGFAVMALTAWIFTGSMAEGGAIALTAAVLGFVSYFLYERLWSRVRWGRIDVGSSPDLVSKTPSASSFSRVSSYPVFASPSSSAAPMMMVAGSPRRQASISAHRVSAAAIRRASSCAPPPLAFAGAQDGH